MSIALVVHGHFYQPPRENPWTDGVEREPTAAPFHDWNARIHAECYRANAFARIHGRGGRIQSIVNNYARMSFNFGPTLGRWIEANDPRAHARLVAADRAQRQRLGRGGAMAQAYAHPIVPLASPLDRRTQILWGLADFQNRFGRPAEGLWLPETAANAATLATLIELGVGYTILAPEQVAAVRAPGEEWTSVDRDTVDTGRAYRWMHPDGSGRFLTVAVFDGPLSRGVAFGDVTRDAGKLVAAVEASAQRSRVDSPLVLCASDGELYGHHKKFADLSLAFAAYVEGPRRGIEPTNLGAYLDAHPATWEMELGEGEDGKGTSWSCVHGVGRWWRDCGCTMVAPEQGWNHRWRTPLRAAMDALQQAAANFFEDAGAELLLDPWGARDAYGTVVDASRPDRDALLATYATPALARGGEEARDRARLLLELQRATLLMYASCGWYFDDIAGLESSLVLRLAAYAADLMVEAGARPPVDEMLDLLASAKSNIINKKADAKATEKTGNRPGAGQTGADVFRRVAGDRITPQSALATVVFGRAATAVAPAAPARPVDVQSPGFDVEVLDQSSVADDQQSDLSGSAHVTIERTGAARVMEFAASFTPGSGFQVRVDGAAQAIADLGRENRNRLLPLLLPQLESLPDPVAAAGAALELGREVIGFADGPEELGAHRCYARLLIRLLGDDKVPSPSAVSAALGLLEAAGPALAPGTPDRALVEELLADLLTPSSAARLAPLADKLGFSLPSPSPAPSPSPSSSPSSSSSSS